MPYNIKITKKDFLKYDRDKKTLTATFTDTATKKIDLSLADLNCNAQWHIFDLNRRVKVDTDDYTGGPKVELQLSAAFAGNPNHPQVYRIETRSTTTDQVYDTLLLESVYTQPVQAQWIKNGVPLQKIDYNQEVIIDIKNHGIIGTDVILEIYQIVQGQELARLVESRNIKPKYHTGSDQAFFLDKAKLGKQDARFYFILKQKLPQGGTTILFDGLEQQAFLDVSYSFFYFPPIEQTKSLSPVIISPEEFFTQRYEPCKFTAIDLEYKGKTTSVFKETVSVPKIENTPRNIGVITGDQSVATPAKLKTEALTVIDCFQHLVGQQKHTMDNLVKTEIAENAAREITIENAAWDTASKIYTFTPVYNYEGTKKKLSFLAGHFLLPFKKAELNIRLETCRYQKSIDLSIYPDLHWIYQNQTNWNTDENVNNAAVLQDIFFKDIKVELVNGLNQELDFLQPYISILFGRIPIISTLIADYFIDYLKELAQRYSYGFHGLYNFETPNQPQILDYSKEYSWIAKSYIAFDLLQAIAIELLILYITRGRGTARLGKAAQAVQTTSKAKRSVETQLAENGFTIIYPKVNRILAFYYEAQDDGRIALIQEARMVAKPLFGIQYLYENSLGSFIAEKAGIAGVFDQAKSPRKIGGKLSRIKSWLGNAAQSLDESDIQSGLQKAEEQITDGLDALVQKLGVNAKLMITFNGVYEADLKIKINHLMGSISLDDSLNNYIDRSQVTFGQTKGIDAMAEIEAGLSATFKWSLIYKYAPNFLKNYIPEENTTLNVSAKAQMFGTLYFERVYKRIGTGAYKDQAVYSDNQIFTGIQGSVIIKVEEKEGDDEKKSKAIYRQIDFVLIEPFTIEGVEIPLFEQPKNPEI